jgi:hypothetical protein
MRGVIFLKSPKLSFLMLSLNSKGSSNTTSSASHSTHLYQLPSRANGSQCAYLSCWPSLPLAWACWISSGCSTNKSQNAAVGNTRHCFLPRECKLRSRGTACAQCPLISLSSIIRRRRNRWRSLSPRGAVSRSLTSKALLRLGGTCNLTNHSNIESARQ